MVDLLNLRFVTVVGKGGVGKTTVSAALALAAARRGKRVLIAMCNSKERLGSMLEVGPIGEHVRTILPDIDAVNMTPKSALEEYGMMVLKVRAVYRAIFENRFVAAFLRGTPGIEAWSMLGKAHFHAHEELPDGRPRYDMVILDSPATGHGLEMLRVPKVLLDVAPPGMLRREAERAWALFSDARKAGALLVSLPEDMPANETIELHAALRNELHLPVAGLVVNGVLPRLFSTAERSWLGDVVRNVPGDDPAASLFRAGYRRSLRELVQEESISRLALALDLPRYELPMRVGEIFKRTSLLALSHAFDIPVHA